MLRLRKPSIFIHTPTYTITTRDSAVGRANGYGLDGRWIGVLVGVRLSPIHVVQAGSGALPAFYRMGMGLLLRVLSGRGVKLTTHL
jgi:hypothetical protein